MKKNLLYAVMLITSICLVLNAEAQTSEWFNNSLRVQYGLVQYNKNSNETINGDNDYFLNSALTYRLRLGSLSGLNITGRYYKWKLDKENKLNTYAAQAMWVLHPRKISSSWSLNRFTPYIGIGLGIEKHELAKASGNDSSFSNIYIPLEAGILFNLSSRWSIGVFGEYKISTEANLKKLVNQPSGSMDLVNAAGISLAYHFGRKSRQSKVPIVYTLTKQDAPVTRTLNRPISGISPIRSKVQDVAVIDTSRLTFSAKKYEVKEGNLRADKITDSTINDILNNDSMMNNVALIDSSNETKKSKYLTLKDSLEATMPKVSLQNGEDNLVYENTFTPDRQNSKRTDSLLRVIQNLSQPSKPEINGERNRNVAPEKLMVIQPEEYNAADDPEIVRLKLSYNELLDLMERNNRMGYTNEAEMQNLRGQSNQIREHIYTISHEKDLNADEVEKLHRIIDGKQAELNKAYASALVENKVSDNNTNVESSIRDMQLKLDMMLLGLKDLKQQPVIAAKDDGATSMLLLLEKQLQLESKIQLIENNNLLLIQKIDSINAKSKTTGSLEKIETDNLLYTIYFDNNSSEVNRTIMGDLKVLADSLSKIKAGFVLLSGFADKSGNAAYNLKLSHRRVNAVKKALLANGLAKEKIVERNFGSNQATSENAESERKVVIRILKN